MQWRNREANGREMFFIAELMKGEESGLEKIIARLFKFMIFHHSEYAQG